MEKAAEVVWSMEIERNAYISQYVVEDKEDYWYLRLPTRPSDKQPLAGFSSLTQVSAVELRPERYELMGCRGCNAMFLGGKDGRPGMEKVLPLPSANYMDMFDFGALGSAPLNISHAMASADLLADATVVNHEDEAAVAPGDNAKEERE
ncbi:hypothetical protein PInf_025097 [Phytophthora infestans]|nr:hypothetical protein PInf_025097 [Phytophthora infestans]